MKNSKDITAPIIVLVCICLVASFLLAGVYQITSPIIAEHEEAAANEAKKAVLPNGDTFEEVAIDPEKLVLGVTNVYKAANGVGYAISTNVKGMYAGLKIMVGVNSNGEVSGVNVLTNEETAGIGSKAMDPAYLEKYIGVKSADTVDGISGATYSSKGVKTAINAALAMASELK